MDHLHAMKVFVKVAECGSFTKAGRQLFMTPTAVTRAVSALEEKIGTRLLARTTRVVKVTEVGFQYMQDCRRILADLEEAEAVAAESQAAPRGTLSVTAPQLFGEMYILPILLEYLAEFPLVTGRAIFTNRVMNIVDEGIEVAIRIGHLQDSTQRAIRVGSARLVVCGAPSYFEKYGMPVKPEDLTNHVIVATNEGRTTTEWRFGADQRSTVTIHPRLFCVAERGALKAVVMGWGLTRLFAYQFAPALLSGELQCVLSDYEEPPLPIHVIYSGPRHVSPKLRTFIDLLVSTLRENPFLN